MRRRALQPVTALVPLLLRLDTRWSVAWADGVVARMLWLSYLAEKT